MTTPTPRWTAETEELVARAIFAHVHPTGDWGSWSAEPHHDYFGDEARKVLTTLADAGVLTAVGGETRHDWRVLAAYDDVGRVVDKHYEWTDITADHARELIADIRALGRSIDRVMRRTPAGPWREVTDDPA